MLFCTLRFNREYYGKTECKNYAKALIDFVVKTCSITMLKMARQEKLFHSLRRFNSYVLTLVTFISETAQEIYYYNARREVRNRLQLFSWYFKIGTKIEMWTLYWDPEVYYIAPVRKTKPKEIKKYPSFYFHNLPTYLIRIVVLTEVEIDLLVSPYVFFQGLIGKM